jgi:hypothetical protein
MKNNYLIIFLIMIVIINIFGCKDIEDSARASDFGSKKLELDSDIENDEQEEKPSHNYFLKEININKNYYFILFLFYY